MNFKMSINIFLLALTVSCTAMTLKHVPQHSRLHASKPNPAWFGNPPNES